MTIQRTATLRCDVDGCEASFEMTGQTAYAGRLNARHAGWGGSQGGGEDYCPDHLTKKSRA